MNAHLELRQINKQFGKVSALSDVNLSVNEGEFVCLLGPSGCGKTTLLRIIAGFEQATSGDILLDGQAINRLPPHKRGFGMVFQSLALFPHMTVAENIAYGMKRKKVPTAQHAPRIAELLEMVQLPEISNRRITELSGGQQQRVAIARALAVPPKLFLLDEPLSALDAQIRENMQIELRQLQQKFGVTTILVTHDQHEAMMLADRLVVLKGGKVQQTDSPSDIYRHPQNEFVAEFLGAANLLPGIVTAQGQLNLLNQNVLFKNDLPVNTAVKLAIRSEDIQITREDSDNDQRIKLPGEIVLLRDLGASTEMLVKCAEDYTIRCHLSRHDVSDYQQGDTVSLAFEPSHCTLFSDDITI